MTARKPLSERIAEARDRAPKPVNYEHIEPQAWGPADITPDQLRLLRGRVLVEPLEAAESSLIVVVKMGRDTEKTLARGRVVAMGPPMLTKGKRCDMCDGEGGHRCEDHEDCTLPCWDCTQCGGSGRIQSEVPHGFEVGDVVLHVGQHRSRDVELANGRFRSVAQEEIQAVIEGEVESVDVSHGGAPDHRTVIR